MGQIEIRLLARPARSINLHSATSYETFSVRLSLGETFTSQMTASPRHPQSHLRFDQRKKDSKEKLYQDQRLGEQMSSLEPRRGRDNTRPRQLTEDNHYE